MRRHHGRQTYTDDCRVKPIVLYAGRRKPHQEVIEFGMFGVDEVECWHGLPFYLQKAMYYSVVFGSVMLTSSGKENTFRYGGGNETALSSLPLLPLRCLATTVKPSCHYLHS